MKHILFIFFWALSFIVYSQTNITGGIFSNQTWTKANSPYTITGNTTVFPNVVLTIEPGVVVKFKPSIQFRVRGTLNINGIENDSVLFTAEEIDAFNPTQSWEGVVIDIGQGGTVSAQYLIFEYSLRGFGLFTGNSTSKVYDFIRCTFRNNNSVIGSNGDDGYHTSSITYCKFINNTGNIHGLSNAIIDHCSFKNGLSGVSGSYSTTLTNSEFSDLDFGIALQDATVDNCYIHHCITGATLWIGLTIINSRLEYNGTALLASYPYSYTSTSIHDNIICGNTYGIKGNNSYPYSISNNCWCLDADDVPTVIYDAYDDALLGIITFDPIITGCTITPPRIVTPPVSTSISAGSINNKKINIYPNPTNQLLQFDETLNNAVITIYTSDSKIISEQKVSTSQIDVSELSTGYYIISIQTDNEKYHSTFIKQ